MAVGISKLKIKWWYDKFHQSCGHNRFQFWWEWWSWVEQHDSRHNQRNFLVLTNVNGCTVSLCAGTCKGIQLVRWSVCCWEISSCNSECWQLHQVRENGDPSINNLFRERLSLVCQVPWGNILALTVAVVTHPNGSYICEDTCRTSLFVTKVLAGESCLGARDKVSVTLFHLCPSNPIVELG